MGVNRTCISCIIYAFSSFLFLNGPYGNKCLLALITDGLSVTKISGKQRIRVINSPFFKKVLVDL